MKYFGSESKQELIDEMYEGEVTLYYKNASYTEWLDGRGYCIGITALDGREATEEEHHNSICSYKTIEEMIDNYVLRDGVKLSEAVEMDTKDLK